MFLVTVAPDSFSLAVKGNGLRPRASTCQSRSLKRYLPPHQIKQINVYHNTSDVKVRLKSNEHSNQLEYMQSSRPKTTTNLSQF